MTGRDPGSESDIRSIPIPVRMKDSSGVIGPAARGIIATVNRWLDAAVAETYQDQPLAQDWARVAKTAEEAGEAMAEAARLDLTAQDRARVDECMVKIGRTIDALIAMTGQNPRKGVCGTQDAMLNELADVICTGMFAIQHFTGDSDQTAVIIEAAMLKAFSRAQAAGY